MLTGVPLIRKRWLAADLTRSLAAARPDAFTPDLASALNTLSNCLSELGRREAAMEAAQEAADLTRTLATARAAVPVRHVC